MATAPQPHSWPKAHEILLKEWDICEAGISRYDGFLFQIRSWNVTLFSASLALSVSQKEWPVIAVSVVITLMFWFAEGNAKLYQQVFIDRTREIEANLRDGQVVPPTPVLARRFQKKTIGKWREFFPKFGRNMVETGRLMFTGHTAILYVLMIVASLVATHIIYRSQPQREPNRPVSITIVHDPAAAPLASVPPKSAPAEKPQPPARK